MNRLRRLLNSSPRTLDSITAYEKWAKSYPATAHNVLMQIEQKTMRSLLPDLADQTVLDLACGTGRYGKLAQSQGANCVIGVDNSFAMLKNREIAQVSLATAHAIPLQTASIDVILCGLALGHLPELKPALSEMSRILKPQGIALISDFHPYQFLSGAKRTFQFDNQTFAVEHYVHHVSDYFSIANQHNLTMSAIQEPTYQGQVPIVLVMQFRKN